jgi:magnesium-transporting ATPase (P-type)
MPKVFGWEHFTYLFVVIFLMVLGFIWIQKHIKTEEQIAKTIKVIGLMLFLAIVWNRVSVAYLRDGFQSILPGTFCGATSLALSISAMLFKKDHIVFHCLGFIGLLGGLLTLVYPDYIGQSSSIFYPMTISGLVHHTVMVFLVLVMFQTEFLKPTLKKFYALPFGLCVYMTYGIFLISVLGYHDAMYIYEPILEGTPLNWIVLGLIYLPLHFIFLGAWGILSNRKLSILQRKSS